MSASFNLALPWILAHEGGWSDDPDDAGGATNFGITFETAQRHGIHTKSGLQAITPDQVASIYRADYWRFDLIDSQQVATKLLDMAVNMGTIQAVRLAQDAMNSLGASLDVDGRWGPQTCATVNSLATPWMLDALCAAAEAFYQTIADRKPAQRKFLAGWLKRAAAVPA